MIFFVFIFLLGVASAPVFAKTADEARAAFLDQYNKLVSSLRIYNAESSPVVGVNAESSPVGRVNAESSTVVGANSESSPVVGNTKGYQQNVESLLNMISNRLMQIQAEITSGQSSTDPQGTDHSNDLQQLEDAPQDLDNGPSEGVGNHQADNPDGLQAVEAPEESQAADTHQADTPESLQDDDHGPDSGSAPKPQEVNSQATGTRTLIDAPDRDCGEGQKRDMWGNCRDIF